MTTLADLLRRVDAAFARTGARTPGWTDPHPDRSPADDEYSRVTDPGKWRIVGARADAWLEALAEAGVATIRADVDVAWEEPPGPVLTRTTLVVPEVEAGLPLVVARSRIESVDDAGITLGAGDPAVGFVWIPDCGCDACDSGSQAALDELDRYLLAIVTGRYRRVGRGRKSVTITPNSREARNLSRRERDTVLTTPPRGWRVLDGPSWLSPG